MSKSFIFYESFYQAITELEPTVKSRLFDGICKYALYGEEMDGGGVEKAVFTLIKPQLDANRKRRENGEKGGRPKTKTKPSHNLDKTKPEPNDNVNVNVNGNVKKESKPKKVIFKPPTLEEVREYCKKDGNSVDPKSFYDYYHAGNWVDSKGNKVRNWKQKLLTWKKYDSSGNRTRAEFQQWMEKNNE
jgi:hypothetical protein